MLAVEEPLISVEEYLEGEKVSEIRHEYVAGQVYAMTGTSKAHNQININLAFHLRAVTRGQSCKVFVSDIKVRVPAQDAFYYPDLILTCEPDHQDDYVISAPCLIAEVLSPSTKRIDSRHKWLGYQQLSSLRYYLLIVQDRPFVECYARQGDTWCYQALSRMEDALPIDCPPITLQLNLADLYEEVTLP
ncbi:hypothetical protein Thiowin_02616 [Thiorhodovibrio winogradskyi]|uniref:Putative restriction endonuclease domain-containing protein n=1 Tax=Thiorhodovibrio winogradskyi TaxID=77007 RepID=A0ABZ0SC17_9GAMM|nr:Uma2 family endonuclease [Thiorhodovibrio winogradskyi]